LTQHQPAVMTVEEIAAYLRIPRSSVYKLAQEGRIPCQKVGRQWRFYREAINEWISGNTFKRGGPESFK
jgi:excisionase family DNA binding protein